MTDWPWLLAGMTVGVVNILMLKATLGSIGPQARAKSWLWLGLGTVVRTAIVIGIMILAAQRGFVPALLVFTGFWLIRWPLLFWLNKSTLRK